MINMEKNKTHLIIILLFESMIMPWNLIESNLDLEIYQVLKCTVTA